MNPNIPPRATKAKIGYTTSAISGKGIPNIQAKSNANNELQEKVSLTSQKSFEVSHA